MHKKERFRSSDINRCHRYIWKNFICRLNFFLFRCSIDRSRSNILFQTMLSPIVNVRSSSNIYSNVESNESPSTPSSYVSLLDASQSSGSMEFFFLEYFFFDGNLFMFRYIDNIRPSGPFDSVLV